MIVKVCGMREPRNIEAVANVLKQMPYEAWMGFIFYPRSPRCVDRETWHENMRQIKHLLSVKTIGVFVDSDIEEIAKTQQTTQIDGIQLHGHEDAEYIQTLKHAIKPETTIIKAIPISETNDVERAYRYDTICNYLLFDTKLGTQTGGTGQRFNWEILQDYNGETPFILSGGIGIDNIYELNSFNHPKWAGIDLNSRFETTPAMKDITLLDQFLQGLRSVR